MLSRHEVQINSAESIEKRPIERKDDRDNFNCQFLSLVPSHQLNEVPFELLGREESIQNAVDELKLAVMVFSLSRLLQMLYFLKNYCLSFLIAESSGNFDSKVQYFICLPQTICQGIHRYCTNFFFKHGHQMNMS